MSNHAGIPAGIREGIWPEAAFTAILWHNAIVQKEGNKPPHTLFWGVDPNHVCCLHPFGELAIALDPTV